MGIFFNKSLFCGCQIVAAQSREDKNCVFLVNHTYKWICSKCINMPSEKLNQRLEDMKKCDDKIYVSFINGWYRSNSSPTDYSTFINLF
jgi:hypothetical protein